MNRITTVQECGARDDDSSNVVWTIKHCTLLTETSIKMKETEKIKNLRNTKS